LNTGWINRQLIDSYILASTRYFKAGGTLHTILIDLT
jgi:hypothetical protein